MAADFYTEWLQVPPGERPPDHYALLGLPLFCDDKATIDKAARKRLARLDRYGIHPDPAKRDTCHRLMNEVARARVVLATPARKQPYDQELARRRGLVVPEPANESQSAEQVATAAEQTEADAEAYLMDLAQAAQGAISSARSRTRVIPKRNPLPAYVAIICGAALVCIGIWAWLHTSRQPQKTLLATEKPIVATTSAAPAPRHKPQPPPEDVAPPLKSKLFVPIDATPSAPPKVAPVRPPAPPVQPPRVAAPHPADPVAALNASLDRLTDWTVEKGIWSFVEPGRLRGEGPSDINFDVDLPSDATISFRLCVVKGMRPRIHFDGPDIYVGNEGYSKKLTVHGKIKDVSGEALDYKNGQDIAVTVMFHGADRFEVRLGDHILTGKCQPHSRIHLRFSGGDWWSKGTTDYWDVHVSRSS